MARNEKYAVVKFLSDGTYNEIPTVWLITDDDDNEQCWWPPRTANSKLLIANCALPNYNTWIKHDVNIVKYCTSLESAYKSAADTAYWKMDEERLGRGHRQRFHPYRFEEEEYDYCQTRKHNSPRKHSNTNIVSVLPSSSHNGSNNTKDLLQLNNTNECNITTYYYENENEATLRRSEDPLRSDEIPIIIEGYTSLTQNKEEDLNVKQSIEKILHMQVATNALLNNIKQRITRLEHFINSPASKNLPLPENNSIRFIAKFLPLNTIEAIKEFNSILKTSDETVTHFKEFVSKIGGNNPRHTVQRTMEKIFTNECAMQCSLKGRKNNFAVNDLHIIKIMRDVILQQMNLTELGFDNIVSEWLRFAKQRKMREDKGKQNVRRKEDNEKNYA